MCPEQSALGGGHHYSPRVQAGSGDQRGGPQPGAHPGAEEVPVQPALLSRDLARHPGPPPHFPADDGQAEEEQAAGLARGGPHRKRHCSWSCDSKKHRMPGSPPPLWPLPPPRRPTPGRSEQDRVGQRPSPSPWTSRPSTARLLLPGPPATATAGRFSNTPPPLLVLVVPGRLFLGISARSSSKGTSSRKSPCPSRGSAAHSQAHTASLGFPHAALTSPPQPGSESPARAGGADPLLAGTDARGQVGSFLGGVSCRMEEQPYIWVGVRPSRPRSARWAGFPRGRPL